jgi:hypothetical protein
MFGDNKLPPDLYPEEQKKLGEALKRATEAGGAGGGSGALILIGLGLLLLFGLSKR